LICVAVLLTPPFAPAAAPPATPPEVSAALRRFDHEPGEAQNAILARVGELSDKDAVVRRRACAFLLALLRQKLWAGRSRIWSRIDERDPGEYAALPPPGRVRQSIVRALADVAVGPEVTPLLIWFIDEEPHSAVLAWLRLPPDHDLCRRIVHRNHP